MKKRTIKRRRTPRSCVISGIYGSNTHHEYDTRNDFGLLIESLTIPLPTVKTEISAPFGMHGSLDASEISGKTALDSRIFYESRKIKIVFGVEDREKYYHAIDNYDLKRTLHGHERIITFEDDPDFCWTGRMTVTSWDPYAIIPHITVEMLAHPFKREIVSTKVSTDRNNWIIGLTNAMVTLDSSRTTAETNTFTQSNGFTIRGLPGQISVWEIELPVAGFLTLYMRRRTDVRYGGHWELRNSNWDVIEPVAGFTGRSTDQTTMKYVYIVFYIDYEVNYRYDNALLINGVDILTIDVGEEEVFPQVFCNHDNCVLIDRVQHEMTAIPYGLSTCYDILLQPGNHELMFACLIPDSSWTWTYECSVQRGYL